jgi:DNA-binding GntR family transcriptional regulator
LPPSSKSIASLAAIPRRAGTIVATIGAQVEEDIVLGRLHPRQRLVEQDLAERFSTHRAVIRQVLADLDRKGLVERIPNRGATVKDLLPVDVKQIYAVREELEVMAGRIIPLPVAPADMAQLAAIQAIHDKAVKVGHLRDVFYSNLKFHQLIFALCGNPHLTEMIELLAGKVYGVRAYSNTFPPYLQKVREQHHAMLDALGTGRRDDLIDLLRAHLRPSLETYVSSYNRRFGDGSERA